MNGYPTWQGHWGTAVDPSDNPDLSDTLTGRTALVTASSGVGEAIIHGLALRGASVAVCYPQDKDQAEQMLSEIRAEGVDGSIHQADTGDHDDCHRVIAEVVNDHGSLDILVNNTGTRFHTATLDVTDLDWERALSLNLRGVALLSQAALGHMAERGTGRIINVTSSDGTVPGQTASISGLFGLTRTLAKEAAFMLHKEGQLQDNPIGITVNAVIAGFVDTEIIGIVPEEVIKRLIDQIPLGRFARPEEIARLVEFLAADESGYITGQIWGVNGGMDI